MMKDKNITIKLEYLAWGLFIFFFVNMNSAFSQNWVENELTDYFKDKAVWDFGFSKDALWVLTSEPYKTNGIVITKCNGDSRISYYMSDVSDGSLSRYIIAKSNENDFYPSRIKVGKSKVWLIDITNTILAVIQKDSIKFVDCKNIKKNILKSDCALDKNDDIYFFEDYLYDPNQEYGILNIYSSDGITNLKKYKDTLNPNHSYSLLKILFFGKSRCCIFHKAEDNNLTICKYNDYGEITDSLFLYNTKINKYYTTDDNIYLYCTQKKSSNACIIILDSKLNIKNVYNLSEEFGKYSCMYFAANEKYAFFSDGAGFFQFNYSANRLNKVTEKVNKEFYGKAFRKLLINDNIVYGCYNGLNDFMDCKLLEDNGLYLYKTE